MPSCKNFFNNESSQTNINKHYYFLINQAENKDARKTYSFQQTLSIRE